MISLIAFCSLAAAVALPNPVQPATTLVDENDPSAADPIIPPTSISFPIGVDNPFPNGMPDMPDGCDGEHPSDDCFQEMKKKSNYIWFDRNSDCTDEQKAQINTAVWDATTLANYASTFPNSTQNRGQASGVFWMGPDWAKFSNRIAGNFKRVGNWRLSNQNEYITVSCKDTEKICNKDKGKGMSVGGYAWTYSGWTAYYHYITLCPPFFTLESLGDKMDDIENELARGNTKYATNMLWLRTSGQYFLHEMMHTRIADGGIEPHIGDQLVDRKVAYGPARVHSMATHHYLDNGGAKIGSINSDSYVYLANSMWWWDTTGYFPGLLKDATVLSDDADAPDLPVSLFVNLYDAIDPRDIDWDQMYAPQVEAYQGIGNDLSEVPTSTIFVLPIPATPTPAP